MSTGTRFGTAGGVLLALITSACATAPVPDTPEPAVTRVTEPPLLASALRTDHPSSYTVQPGDNVYEVSAKFLREPWRWQGLWEQQDIPKLYPGTVLQLGTSDGAPRLAINRGARPTIRLSPRVRVQALVESIPTIPREAIAPFLNNATVMSRDEWQAAPYIVGNEHDAILATVGQRVYARGDDFLRTHYRVFRPSDPLREPGSPEVLGYAMSYIGEVAVEEDGDPAAMRVVDAERGLRPGDRLVLIEEQAAAVDFVPRPVPPDTEGMIISVLDAGIAAGRYNSVVVSLGADRGIKPGHVLAVYSDGATVVDPITGETVRLPDNRSGVIVVYKVFDYVSYGLIAELERHIQLYDRVGEP